MVGRMLAVTVQATLDSTTNMTAVQRATHAAMLIGPQLPPVGPRRRPLITFAQCLRDDRLARGGKLDFNAKPKRLAKHRDDSILQVVVSVMRMRLKRAELQEFLMVGSDFRGKPPSPKGHRVSLEHLRVFVMVLGMKFFVAYELRKRAKGARSCRREIASACSHKLPPRLDPACTCAIKLLQSLQI